MLILFKSHSWERKRQESKIKPCPNCGSAVTFNIEKQRFDCRSCATTFSLAEQEKPKKYTLEAEKLIPFQVSEELAKLKFWEWLSKGKNVPVSVLDKAEKLTLEQLYIPYLELFVRYNASWSADIGYNRVESYNEVLIQKDSKGKKYSEMVTNTRTTVEWQHAKDEFSATIPKSYLIGEGLSELETEFAENVQLYQGKTHDIFLDQAFFSGTNQLEVNQDKQDLYFSGITNLARKEAEKYMMKHLPGDTNRNAKLTSFESKSKGYYLYVPFWKIRYTYKEQEYTVLVSALDSKNVRLEGQKPLNEKQFNTSRAMRKKGRIALVASIGSFLTFGADLPFLVQTIFALLLFGGFGMWVYYAIRRIIMYFTDKKQLKDRLSKHPDYQILFNKLKDEA